jgi:hypothetical protein
LGFQFGVPRHSLIINSDGRDTDLLNNPYRRIALMMGGRHFQLENPPARSRMRMGRSRKSRDKGVSNKAVPKKKPIKKRDALANWAKNFRRGQAVLFQAWRFQHRRPRHRRQSGRQLRLAAAFLHRN